ncbi:MAG: hypothetical protein P4M13_10940 [Alphaproteobacteria bacterium]|nr:hypothetical protein [Alphaproteobacteria bacterium]
MSMNELKKAICVRETEKLKEDGIGIVRMLAEIVDVRLMSEDDGKLARAKTFPEYPDAIVVFGRISTANVPEIDKRRFTNRVKGSLMRLVDKIDAALREAKPSSERAISCHEGTFINHFDVVVPRDRVPGVLAILREEIAANPEYEKAVEALERLSGMGREEIPLVRKHLGLGQS